MASIRDSPPASQVPEEIIVLDTPVLAATAVTDAEESQIPPAALPPSQSSLLESSKFASPVLDTGSITPPPSSQVTAPPRVSTIRAQSPALSHLTSPPPTSQSLQAAPPALTALPRDEDIETASVEELRNLVHALKLELKESRTTAAHIKLQYNMLAVDSAETQNRMMVELEMAQREIEVLQQAEERRRQAIMSPSSAAAEATTIKVAAMNELARQRDALSLENDQMRDMINQTKKALEYKDGVIATHAEEIERLRRRIRANREHMNGLLDNMYEATGASPRSHLGTPHRTPGGHGLFSTPRQAAPQRAILPTSQARDNRPFEALLLADKVLSGSQETTSITAPSTPRTQPAKRSSHVRGAQSLSSLPSTPSRNRAMPSAASRPFQTPPQLSAILEPASVPSSASRSHMVSIPPPVFSLATGPGARRRASSDSTITASSVDGVEPSRARNRDVAVSGSADDNEDDEIPESQASQAATSMLRRTPVQRGGSMHTSFGSQPSSQQQRQLARASQDSASKLTQSRIVGKIVKHPHHAAAGLSPARFEPDKDKEKRRLTSYGTEHASPSKKSRTDGVGLGILPASPAK